MDDYLAKPARARRLFETIDAVLGKAAIPAAPSVEDKTAARAPASARRPAFATPGASAGPNRLSDSGFVAAIQAITMPHSEVVDWQVALHSVSSDHDLLAAVVETFLVEAPRLMQELHAAADRSDPTGVWQSAHTLKTSLNDFGVRKGFELALQLEKMGRQSDLSGVEEALTALDGQMAQVTSDLTRYEQGLRAQSKP